MSVDTAGKMHRIWLLWVQEGFVYTVQVEIILVALAITWWIARNLCFADLILAVNNRSYDLSTLVYMVFIVSPYQNHQSVKLKIH